VSVDSIAVVGLGYVGMPTAAILAAHSLKVLGVDVNQRTVDAVNRGHVPFAEPDLATYVAGAVKQGFLRATTAPEPADAFIIAVPTPLQADHRPDLSYVRSAVDALAPVLRGGELVVLESTSPPGTTRRAAEWILAARPDLSLDGSDGRPIVHVAYCPERVLPGSVMIELVTNDRIVGGLTPEAAQRAKDLYSVFCQGQVVLTDAVTAEMVKLAENSFRDVNIAYANELAAIADQVGVDAWELIRLANHHPRVDILQPGPGVGGHCVAVDPWFLVDAVDGAAPMLRAARDVNDSRPDAVVERVLEAVDGVAAPKIAALGLTFKANVDDLRGSPAVEIVRKVALRVPEAVVRVSEPFVDALPPELEHLPNLSLTTPSRALKNSDLAVLLVDHKRFRRCEPLLAAHPCLIDTRGFVRADAASRRGRLA
jgi:UDP-N-acetyl-D-mannosaminuronic acid dehydrogenase